MVSGLNRSQLNSIQPRRESSCSQRVKSRSYLAVDESTETEEIERRGLCLQYAERSPHDVLM